MLARRLTGLSMSRISIYLATGLILLLVSGLVSAERIFKWVDEHGQVRYGDRPPEQADNLESIDVAPGPTADQKRQAQELLQQNIEQSEKYKSERERKAAELQRQQKVQPGEPVSSKEDEADDEDRNTVIYRCRDGSFSTNCYRPPVVKPKPPLIKPKPVHPIEAPARPATLPSRQ